MINARDIMNGILQQINTTLNLDNINKKGGVEKIIFNSKKKYIWSLPILWFIVFLINENFSDESCEK